MTITEISKKLDEYIKFHDSELCMPYFKEFCDEVGQLPDEIMKMAETNPRTIGRKLKLLEQRREVILQRGMITKTLDREGCKFALKQMGWKDSVESDVKASIDMGGDISRFAK